MENRSKEMCTDVTLDLPQCSKHSGILQILAQSCHPPSNAPVPP